MGVLLEWDAGYPVSENEIFDRIESELGAARLALGTPSTPLPGKIAHRRRSAALRPRISPMSFDGQDQLEAAFEGAYASIGRAAQEDGLHSSAVPLPATDAFDLCSRQDQQVLLEFLAARWGKRLEFLAAPFRATIRYLACVHGWDRERVGRSLDATFPRVSADEERLGFRCSETRRFRGFVLSVARLLQDTVLVHLAAYEAEMELLTFRSSQERQPAGADLRVGAELSLSTHAALFRAPFDVVTLHTGLSDPNSDAATLSALLGSVREQNVEARVAIVALPRDGLSVYQMDARSFDRLSRLTSACAGRRPIVEDVSNPFLRSAVSAGIVTTS